MMRRVDLLPAIYERQRRERRNLLLVIIAGIVVRLLLVPVFLWLVLGPEADGGSQAGDWPSVCQGNRVSICSMTLPTFPSLE